MGRALWKNWRKCHEKNNPSQTVSPARIDSSRTKSSTATVIAFMVALIVLLAADMITRWISTYSQPLPLYNDGNYWLGFNNHWRSDPGGPPRSPASSTDPWNHPDCPIRWKRMTRMRWWLVVFALQVTSLRPPCSRYNNKIEFTPWTTHRVTFSMGHTMDHPESNLLYGAHHGPPIE